MPLQNLTRRIAILTMILFVSMAGSIGAANAGIQDFYVRNNSKHHIWYIYVSPSYSNEWEEDVLGSDVLPPNTELSIEMTGYGNHCDFDVKVEDENGYSQEYFDVDLCSVLYVDFP